TGISAEKPVYRKDDAAGLLGVCREIDGVGKESRLCVLVLGVEPQKRVPEHRGRAVDVCRSKDKRCAARGKSGVPVLVTDARLTRHPVWIECKLLVQPGKPCYERALGILPLVGFPNIRVKARERGFELRLRIAFAVGRVVKLGAGDQAVN